MTAEEMKATIERLTVERDTAAATARALAEKLAGQGRDRSSGDRVYVSALSESDLDDLWFDWDADVKAEYWDNGEDDDCPSDRWELHVWDWNAKRHVIAFAATKKELTDRESEYLDVWRRGGYSLWRFLNSRIWRDS